MKRSASTEQNSPKRQQVIDLSKDDMEELGCVTWHVTPLASAKAPTPPASSSGIDEFLRHHQCDDREHEHILRVLEARAPTLQVDFTFVGESRCCDEGTQRKAVLVRVCVNVLHVRQRPSWLRPREGNYEHYTALINFLAMLCDRRESMTCPQLPLSAKQLLDLANTSTADVFVRQIMATPRANTGLLTSAMLESLQTEDPVTTPLAGSPDLDLAVELRGYQQEACDWMEATETSLYGAASRLWCRFPTTAGTMLYFSPVLQCLTHLCPPAIHGGLLLQDTGMGKTIETIALMLRHPRETAASSAAASSAAQGGTLILCPPSLVGQWVQEIADKSRRTLRVHPYHGAKRKRLPAELAQFDVVVTTYSVVGSEKRHNHLHGDASSQPPLEAVHWHRIVLDESHSIARAEATCTQATLALRARHKWCLSGTPIVNSSYDLRNSLTFLGFDEASFPIVLRSYYWLREIQRDCNTHLLPLRGILRATAMVHAKQQTRRGVPLVPLPPLTHHVVQIPFVPDEQRRYHELESVMRHHATHLSCPRNAVALQSCMIPCRRACSGGGRAAAVDVAEDDAEEGSDDEDTCPICLCPPENARVTPCGHTFCFLCISQALHRSTACPLCRQSISMPQLQRHASAGDEDAMESKHRAVLAKLRAVLAHDATAKVLIFSQFQSSVDALVERCCAEDVRCVLLSGRTPQRKRARVLHDFQTNPATRVCVMSARAGACGLNLTAANHVILVDAFLHDAMEKQAVARMHRLGQTRPTSVWHMLMSGSIEERIWAWNTQRPLAQQPDATLLHPRNARVTSVVALEAMIHGEQQ